MQRFRAVSLLVAIGLVAAPAAQQRDWWPGATYDAAIPTPLSVFGYQMGDYLTEHGEMTAYMRQLDAASDRVRVFSVGRSYERRELLVVAVSSAANIARLDEIRESVARLRDPRTLSATDAQAVAASTPAVAWLNFANDGNESAAFETGIQMAYHLAAGTDAATRRVLDNVVTIIYPAHNPESHSRHVAWMRASATGNPNPDAQEHRGDWRMDTNNNHYQIDLNRDSVFLSQVESQVAAREMHRWNPVLFIDFHGNPDRYFFPPWARPVNKFLPDTAKTWVDTYGKGIASAFDRGGWTYFTRQVFDLHYPGYWDSYPALNGATGMTFETDGGGSKGLAYELPDGRVTTLAGGTLRHFVAGFSSLLTTAENKDARLRALYDFRATAIADVANEPVKQFVLVPGADAQRAADLVGLLQQHDIEVHRLTARFQSSGAHAVAGGDPVERSFAPGAFVILASQPQKRLLRTLLDRETPMDQAFLDEALAAKAYNDSVGDNAPRKSYGFYDINAWSLPLAYGVEAYWTEDRAPAGSLERLADRPAISYPAPPRARFGYLFRWNSRGATRIVSTLWREGFQVSLAREEFAMEGRAFQGGTALVRVETNPDTLHARIAELAAANEVEVVPVQSALVESGRDLGDRSVVDLEMPTIAVVTERPTSVTAYGAIWYLFDQIYGIPFTALRADGLASADLKKYNVIVLPDGSAGGYASTFGESGTDRLEAWVRDGGTLVAIKGAAAWAARQDVGLTAARDKFAESEDVDDPPRRIDQVPGAYVRMTVDTDHYLGVGIDNPLVALFRSNVVFTPSDDAARVATLEGAEPVVAGFFFDEALEHLTGAPFVWDEPTGRGHVTLFADDVTFRTFLHAAHRLLLNAVLLGPSL